MKRYRKQLIVISLLVILAVAFGLGESFVERWRAEELLKLFAKVDLGAAPSPAVITELEKFKGYRSKDSPGLQSGESYDQFVFQNRGFVLLALAPSKILFVQINLKDGIVVGKVAHFAEAPNRGAVVTEEMNIDNPQISNSQGPPPGPRQVEERGVFTEPTYMLSVRDSAVVPENRRQMDWMLDISCMTRPGPCGDFRRVLRGAFE